MTREAVPPRPQGGFREGLHLHVIPGARFGVSVWWRLRHDYPFPRRRALCTDAVNCAAVCSVRGEPRTIWGPRPLRRPLRRFRRVLHTNGRGLHSCARPCRVCPFAAGRRERNGRATTPRRDQLSARHRRAYGSVVDSKRSGRARRLAEYARRTNAAALTQTHP